MKKADLHIHTIRSDDAVLEPEQVFRTAQERGLAAVAFTDHERTAHVDEGARLSRRFGVAFLPGIEISSSWHGELSHVLGYFADGPAPSFETFLAETIWQERRRVQLYLLERLQRRDVAITVAEYDAEAQAGGNHLPLYRLMLKKGLLSNVREYIVFRGAEDVRYSYPPIPEVAQAVHEAGGIISLAHPGTDGSPGVSFFRFDADAITALAAEGLDGVEVFHPSHTEAQTDYYAQVANRLGLLKTGGSDTHRPTAPVEQQVGGKYCDWDEVLRYLRERD